MYKTMSFLWFMIFIVIVKAETGEHVLTFDSFEDYKLHHNKTYLRTFNEDRSRKAFAENLRLIDEHNAGNHTFMLRPNSLADMVSDLIFVN